MRGISLGRNFMERNMPWKELTEGFFGATREFSREGRSAWERKKFRLP